MISNNSEDSPFHCHLNVDLDIFWGLFVLNGAPKIKYT